MRKKKVTQDMILLMRELRRQGMVAKVIREKLIEAGYADITTQSINRYCKDITKNVKLKRPERPNAPRAKLDSDQIEFIRKLQADGFSLKIIREKLIEAGYPAYDLRLLNEYTVDIRKQLSAAGLQVGMISLTARNQIISYRKDGYSLKEIQKLLREEHGLIKLSTMRGTLRHYKVTKPLIPKFAMIEIKRMLEQGYTISAIQKHLQQLGFRRSASTLARLTQELRANMRNQHAKTKEQT